MCLMRVFFFFGSSWNDCWEGRSGCDCNGAAAVLRVHRITGNTAGREEGERESRVPECTVKLRLYVFFFRSSGLLRLIFLTFCSRQIESRLFLFSISVIYHLIYGLSQGPVAFHISTFNPSVRRSSLYTSHSLRCTYLF